MNKQPNSNAKQALNMLKMEVANELGYNYNSVNDKIESNAPQGTLEGTAKNVLAGEQVGGQMTKNLVAMGEQALLNKYNSNQQ
ncbi:small, acid-soluble spore protein, alpha/beta type [Romboutsia weinsteinii]|uniref:Small, acid-soluble spore protein, alpha/beta type n=1 Tax=Romboutsia weinsteinii TaxID=2020949 RepID=A0A371J8R6_9FIRM|nr:small, acid-soluble spore protein, alpha/beta type [Romboutsia weinsteinii]RDY29125.1 small, acid-soluble spore protein, alpha/beta type [Romboutsia weinsteinii]